MPTLDLAPLERKLMLFLEAAYRHSTELRLAAVNKSNRSQQKQLCTCQQEALAHGHGELTDLYVD